MAADEMSAAQAFYYAVAHTPYSFVLTQELSTILVASRLRDEINDAYQFVESCGEAIKPTVSNEMLASCFFLQQHFLTLDGKDLSCEKKLHELQKDDACSNAWDMFYMTFCSVAMIGNVTHMGLQRQVRNAELRFLRYNPNNEPVTDKSPPEIINAHNLLRKFKAALACANESEWMKHSIIGLMTISNMHNGASPTSIVHTVLRHCMKQDKMPYNENRTLQENITAYLGYDSASEGRNLFVAATALCVPYLLILPKCYILRDDAKDPQLITRDIQYKDFRTTQYWVTRRELSQIYCCLLGINNGFLPKNGNLLDHVREVQPLAARNAIAPAYY